jgi:uncharacterized repeat protein (TIGR01451 family)
MARTVRRWGLVLLAAGLAWAGGCSGMTQTPYGLPGLLPNSGVVQTHAKPAGPGYFTNFDPHACKIDILPADATNPVRSHHVLVATVTDENGQPRGGRRVEWMLEGVGNIIEVDESGYTSDRGYKTNNQYAVSYTCDLEHRISRNNGNPADDFVIRPGQTWCVVSSAVEGDSHVTAYAPEIANWDNHKVYVTAHWADADWVFPRPAVSRAGTQHVFTTGLFRHSDRQPLAGYRVRYKILDGPPAVFLPDQKQEAEVATDSAGSAGVTLAQAGPAMGVNRIGVEVLRPPDPTRPGGTYLGVAHSETSMEWQAPQVTLAVTGPPSAAAGQELPYTIVVANAGQVTSQFLTVDDVIPPTLEYVRSDPPAERQNNDLIWSVGELPGGQSRTIQAVFRPTQPGKVVNTATVVSRDGLKDEKRAETDVVSAGLQVLIAGPPAGAVAAPVTYEITVKNPGSGPAANVVLKDEFDKDLVHESRANPVELTVGTLAPGASKTVRITLTPRRTGRLVNRVTAAGDGGLSATAEHPVTVQEAKLVLRQSGPPAAYVGRPVEWKLLVVNPGEVPLNNVVVRDQLPAEVTFESADAGGQVAGGLVTWNLGTLQPREQRTVQVTGKGSRLTPQAVNVATASADPGLQVKDEARLEVRGLPAFKLQVYDLDDPVEVNGKTTYKIEVTNQGSLPGSQVQVTAVVPAQMKPLSANGPTRPRTEGQTVTFPALDALAPGQTQTYSVDVQALQTGDARFRVELRSATLSAPVIKEESTTIYALPSGPAAAAVTPSSAPRPAAEKPVAPTPASPARPAPEPAPAAPVTAAPPPVAPSPAAAPTPAAAPAPTPPGPPAPAGASPFVVPPPLPSDTVAKPPA